MDSKKSWVDGLKGIAICGVVMIHSGCADLPSALGRLGNIGKNGVQLFFLLSAYLSFCSMERAFAKEMTLKNVKVWLIKKFVRLIPLYYLAIFLYFVFTGGASVWLGSEGHITVGNVLTHIFFVNGFFPHYSNSIIGVEWYIGVLAIFYIMAPLLYKVINSLYKSITAWIIGTFICKVATSILYKCVTTDVEVYSSYIGVFCILSQFSVLLLGIVLYFAVKEDRDNVPSTEKTMASFALLLFGIAMIVGMALGKNYLFGINEFGLFGLWFFAIAYSQHMHSCKIIDNPVFRYLGRYSFPIYLFHCLLIRFYDLYIPIHLQNEVVAWLIKYMCIIGASAIIAYPLTKLADNIITKWLQKLIKE